MSELQIWRYQSCGAVIIAAVSILLMVAVCESTGDRKVNPMKETKWGPKLSDKEVAAISRLSVPELASMVLKGDTLHKMEAVTNLQKGKGWRDNLDLLLSLAEKMGAGDMIVEGLVQSKRVNNSDPADLKAVDKYIDFLEAQLKKAEPRVSTTQAIKKTQPRVSTTQAIKKAKPCVSPTQAIRSLGKAVAPRERTPRTATMPVKAPYGTDRVVKILISQLAKKDWRIRKAAVGWLGNIATWNDSPQTVGEVVASLKSQISKEEKSDENQERKDEMKGMIHRALKRTNRALKRINRREKGENGRSPGAPTRRRPTAADTRPAADKTP